METVNLDAPPASRRTLPSDLPRSLTDRKEVRISGPETEMYDGQSQFLTSPILASPLAFKLSIDDDDTKTPFTPSAEDNDSRLTEMLAAQAAHREDESIPEDENAIVKDPKMPEDEKMILLQKSLHMAASNGDIDRVHRLISEKLKSYVDIDAVDEEGNAPLIYASCFGHHEVVSALIAAGASVDKQDKNQWTPLMWAMTNRHKDITKILLDSGASADVKSSSGRTAFDFAPPNSEMADYLQENGYQIGDGGIGGDFYDSGLSQEKFEQEMEDEEMKRRMMMESSINLEVDLASLGLDERPETPEESDEQQNFVWDRCLYDQMFVFQEDYLEQILDIIITDMVPQRTPSQKPIPANVIFLGARYAHYHATHDLLMKLLVRAMVKINEKIERCQWDMTVLAFWMSNATLLLHYLKKDPGLLQVTNEFQADLADLIHEIFILIIRDAERRMDRVLEVAMLDHETIAGFEDVKYASEWNIFKSKPKVSSPDPVGTRPYTKPGAQPSPRNITSLLSSTLFVLDLYDVHSVITTQVFAQLFYWLGAELFNRVIFKRKYLARNKAMQIRMNLSALEDWAKNNNRTPEHYENGSLSSTGEGIMLAARKHLAPVVQLIQWLQCFSALPDEVDALTETLKMMSRLTPEQLLRACNNYRYEVGEKTLSKVVRRHLQTMHMEANNRREAVRRERQSSLRNGSKPDQTPSAPQTPVKSLTSPISVHTPNGIDFRDEDDFDHDQVRLDTIHTLPFILPTSVDLRLSYGGGYGGADRERERKYIPSVPPEFLAKLDPADPSGGTARRQWIDDDEEDDL